MTLAEALEWASDCEVGDYLIEYDDCGIAPEDDPGSRCGFDDSELADVEKRLRARDLTLHADDCGLVAAGVR